jgi:hypothetical protein
MLAGREEAMAHHSMGAQKYDAAILAGQTAPGGRGANIVPLPQKYSLTPLKIRTSMYFSLAEFLT